MPLMLTRLPDWQSALERFLDDNQNRPFRYGSWDCCHFTCEAVRIITGTDIISDFRNQYRSRKEALRMIQAVTGSISVQRIAEHVTAAHCMPEVPILKAQRGDVALIRRARDFSLGLVALNGREIMTTSRRGLVRIPLALGVRAWQV